MTEGRLIDNGLKINVAKTEHLSTRENPLPMKLNGIVPVPGIGDR